MCVVSSRDGRGGLVVRVGIPLADVYLEFLGGRCRPNTVLAAAYDLKVFFTVVARPPDQVRPADVLAFITAQRTGRGGSCAAAGGAGGRARRRVGRDGAPPLVDRVGVLRVLAGPRGCGGQSGAAGAADAPGAVSSRQGVPLVRAVRRLPRILSPAQVDALMAALRTHRDRAMVAAMVLGGLRRCEVLGLRLEDLRVAERRVFIAEGKGGRQRLIPVSGRFFAAVAACLDAERPPGAGTDRVFVVLKGPRRGQPLSARGMEEILTAARRRAGLDHATCHELRHTCLTRLREAGMALEAVQAQAGHASIESTRIYLNSRVLHQPGEKPQVTRSRRRPNSVSDLRIAAV